MRTVAIISDIHGDTLALDAVMAQIAAEDLSEIWCLGDSANFDSEADAAALARVRSACAITLCGNHDKYLWGDGPDDHVIAPLRLGLYHGSPHDPMHYVWETADAQNALASLGDVRVALHGHMHIQQAWDENLKRTTFDDGDTVDIRDGQHIVCVGSVGEPRDSSGRDHAHWAVLVIDEHGPSYIIWKRTPVNRPPVEPATMHIGSGWTVMVRPPTAPKSA